MPDGPATLWGPPRDSRLSSTGALDGLQPGASRRASRGFFSLFSSSKGQQQQQQPSPPAMKGRLTKSSAHSNQSLPARFDAISLTSPSQRDDPAFSRDPSVHHAHHLSAAPRRDVPTFASGSDQDPLRSLVPHFDPTVVQQRFVPQEKQENNPRVRYETDYSSSSASQSSLALPPSNDSFTTSSPMSPSSSPSFLAPQPTAPIGISPEVRDDPPASVASPLAETYDAVDSLRPMSPPPEYEVIASHRPAPPRNDSAPELRHIEPPGLPHRSATAPIPATPPPAASRRANDRRPQAYDLDRIDELDESNPLGVALHHEGPFQAIASVLKGPSPLGNQPVPPQTRTGAKVPKPGNNGGSLGISPGQVLPRNFQYFQPPVQPNFRQDYNSPQASTSYLPQSQYGQSNMRAPPVQGHPNQWSQSYSTHPSYDPRASYTPPPQPMEPNNSRASYIPPHSQYDPVDDLPQPQNPAQNENPHYDQLLNPHSSAHHVSYSSEDNSAAYGGIEEIEEAPKRNRRSAPPVPTLPQVQGELYLTPQSAAFNGVQPRRHSAQPGFTPVNPHVLHDPNRLNAGQNLSNIRHSPNGQPRPGFIDPRILQNRDQLSAGQNLSGIRRSPSDQPIPELTDSRQQQPYATPQVAGYTPPQGNHVRLDEHDRRRPVSYQPTTHQSNFNQGPFQQAMAENDPRRRVSYQPPPPGAAPAALGGHQFERNSYQQQIAVAMQDRQPSVAPSIATAATARRGPQPQHIPKHLVMPTPLQQNSQLQHNSPSQSYPADHYSPGPQPSQVQPTRAQTIQMAQGGGRQLLRKRSSVVPSAPAVVPQKAPRATRQLSYMEPPPTVPEPPVHRPAQPEKKRAKRLLSKRRTDL
ncbi:hypothetical protein C8R44DRAFT_975653 [Mycena epipterygia]|nr:hypothetical protein C8R44DRAFT_975653 [Mycena epipterygia]